jgi:hypothetical protein
MYNSGVIPSENLPFPFSKEGLVPQGEIPSLKKGDLSLLRLLPSFGLFQPIFWATTLELYYLNQSFCPKMNSAVR